MSVCVRELTSGREEQRRFSDDRHRLKTALQESRGDTQRLQRRVEQLETAGAAAESENASLEEENTRLHKQVGGSGLVTQRRAAGIGF